MSWEALLLLAVPLAYMFGRDGQRRDAKRKPHVAKVCACAYHHDFEVKASGGLEP